MKDLLLSKEEKGHPLWFKIQKHLEHQLNELRESNDNKNNNFDDTQFIRGQISAIRSILK